MRAGLIRPSFYLLSSPRLMPCATAFVSLRLCLNQIDFADGRQHSPADDVDPRVVPRRVHSGARLDTSVVARFSRPPAAVRHLLDGVPAADVVAQAPHEGRGAGRVDALSGYPDEIWSSTCIHNKTKIACKTSWKKRTQVTTRNNGAFMHPTYLALWMECHSIPDALYYNVLQSVDFNFSLALTFSSVTFFELRLNKIGHCHTRW